MAGELLLALDLGTTSVRAIAFEPGGRARGRAARSLTTRCPAPGRVEQDPTEYREASRSVLAEALHRAGAGARDVAGIGIASQRATLVAWDAQSGRALGPAIGWQDQRAVPLAERLETEGLALGAQALATRLAWARHHDPTLREAARSGRLMCGTPDAWLHATASGDLRGATDPGQASCTALYDPRSGDWSRALLERLGLAEIDLPPIAATSGIVGETDARWLGAPVPLAARAGDQQASAFGLGVHRAGQTKLTLGTAAMLDRHTGSERRRAPAGCHPVALWQLAEHDIEWAVEGAVHTAGAVLDWLVSLGVADDVAGLLALAEGADSAGVVFVPALQGLGAPFADDGVHASIGGITRGAGREALCRAALEGLAHRIAALCAALAADDDAPCELRVDGGLARSELVLGLVADATGRVLARPEEVETTALGAGMLAALAVGAVAGPEEFAGWHRTARRIEPQLPAGARAEARARWAEEIGRAREWAARRLAAAET